VIVSEKLGLGKTYDKKSSSREALLIVGWSEQDAQLGTWDYYNELSAFVNALNVLSGAVSISFWKNDAAPSN